MIEIAPGVWQFQFTWRNAFNAYYIEHADGGVVVDASTRWDWRPMAKQLAGREARYLVVTHAHPDHQGSARRLVEKFGLTVAAHEEDVEALEGRARLVRQSGFWEFLGQVAWAGPAVKVGRVLREGDEIGGFKVLHMPGHTPGAIVLFRERDGVAIAGDVMNNNHLLLSGKEHLREPPWTFSFDPAENRRSIVRLAGLRPSVVFFGHGKAMRDLGRLAAVAEGMGGR